MTKRQKYPQAIKPESGIRIKHTIKARTPAQEFYLESLRTSRITFCAGPAGSGKTYLVTAIALEKLLDKEVEKIVITRPVVEAGEKLGFLPGTANEKIAPYLLPIVDAIEAHIGPVKTKELMESGKIEIAPLAYMRGRTFNDAFVILDEAQNATPEQLRMFITRMGYGSTFAVNGDSTQSDLPSRDQGGLTWMMHQLKGSDPQIIVHEFSYSDIVRDPLIATILSRLDGAAFRKEGGNIARLNPSSAGIGSNSQIQYTEQARDSGAALLRGVNITNG